LHGRGNIETPTAKYRAGKKYKKPRLSLQTVSS
jgi:hypothetical protein